MKHGDIDMRPHQREGDRIRKRIAYALERFCAACGEPFEVAPNRPDADYCRSNACKQRRARARLRASREAKAAEDAR